MIGRHGKRIASDEKTELECHRQEKRYSNPIANRVRGKRQWLPTRLLIENASGLAGLPGGTFLPRRFRSRLATIHPGSSDPLERHLFKAIIAHIKVVDFQLRLNKLDKLNKDGCY